MSQTFRLKQVRRSKIFIHINCNYIEFEKAITKVAFSYIHIIFAYYYLNPFLVRTGIETKLFLNSGTYETLFKVTTLPDVIFNRILPVPSTFATTELAINNFWSVGAVVYYENSFLFAQTSHESPEFIHHSLE